MQNLMQLNCSYYGQQIVAAGCSNTPSDKVSLFKFPKDAGLKKSEKSKFNEQELSVWKATDHSFVL